MTTQKDELPDTASKASLGCGNPTALAELKPGEVVFDPGSGAGIDVLLSARRVGPTGKAYGLAHLSTVAMEAAMLAPNAEVSIFPWKEPKERVPLAVGQLGSFFRAHRPA